jgi:hypothetical protein
VSHLSDLERSTHNFFSIFFNQFFARSLWELVFSGLGLLAVLHYLAKTACAACAQSYPGGDGEIIFKQACKLGLEGIVSKRRDYPYRSGRTKSWIKIQNPASAAMLIHYEILLRMNNKTNPETKRKFKIASIR